MKKYSIYRKVDGVLIANGLTAEEVYLMGFSGLDGNSFAVEIIEE